ncbi:MAG: DUF3313 family protein [Gammaproteobacteria bacterium]
MIKARMNVLAALALSLIGLGWLPSAAAEAHLRDPIDRGFLSLDYDEMRTEPREKGFDLIYIAPGAFERLGEYEGVMIDQPEVWIDRTSDYPGTKADYLKAIVDLIRDKLAGALIRGGHDVVEAPGPRVAFVRVALTDLYLKKKPGKKTGGYTAIGAQTSEEMMQTMLKYFDVVEVAFQLEVVDLETEEILGAAVIKRGERGRTGKASDQRLDFGEFLAVVDEYVGRVRCRFDNGKLPRDEWVDCTALSPQALTRLAQLDTTSRR